MKQWFAKHCTPGNEGEWSLRDEKKTRWALWLTSLHPWVLRPLFKEDKPRWSPVITLGSEKKKKPRVERPAQLELMGQSAREVRAPERKLQRSAKAPPSGFSGEVTSMGTWANYLKLKNTLERIRENTPSSHPRSGSVSVPISQTGKPQDAWDTGKNKDFASVERKNELWPGTILVPPNTY